MPVFLLLPMPALLVGCDQAAEYRAVLHDQIAALQATEQILASITDAPTMEAAKVRLEAEQAWFEEIKERGLALPPPSQAVLASLKTEAAGLQDALGRVHSQVRRVEKLSGGARFLQEMDKSTGFVRD